MRVAALFRSHLSELLEAVGSAVAHEMPSYRADAADFHVELDRQRGRVLRSGLLTMLDVLESRHAASLDGVDWSAHRVLGVMECRHGRPITEMLHAPWVVSRAILRFAVDRAPAEGVDPSDLYQLAEVVIEWSDRSSLELSAGYNEERAALAGETEALHRRLIEAVLADPPTHADALPRAASAAGWRPSPHVRVLIAEGDDRADLRRHLPPDTPAAELDGSLIALLPGSSGASDVGTPDQGRRVVAALGPGFELENASASGRAARRAIRLARLGLLDGSRLVDCDEHVLVLLLFADEDLARRFSGRLLAPLAGTRSLPETLAAWTAHGGRLKATAAALGVHPHTVTYRLNRSRELLGSLVDDPSRRLDLHVATDLRAHLDRLTSPG